SYDGPLTIGVYGSRNKLIISGGGSNLNNSATIGAYASSSNNLAVVDGAGSVWTVYFGQLLVALAGSGKSLLITNGGRVNASGSIGSNFGSNNLVEITGTGSVWNGGISVGGGATSNRLVISQGGQLTNGNLTIGWVAGNGGNVVCVTGADS